VGRKKISKDRTVLENQDINSNVGGIPNKTENVPVFVLNLEILSCVVLMVNRVAQAAHWETESGWKHR
jgi:hypothetical protein